MQNISEENRKYWVNRAKGYSKVNQEELTGVQYNNWSKFLIREIDNQFADRDRASIKILDIGAGPGFISIILAKAGYQVTAFDFAKTMLDEAKSNAGAYASHIKFVQGDASELPFEKESFDVIISRNLTWNLQNPKKAYTNWLAVLKRGGLMLIFDANWYSYLVDENKRKAYETDRRNVREHSLEDYNIGENFDTMENIAMDLPLTRIKRPAWDVEYLNSLHAGSVSSINDIGNQLYSEKEKINYNSTPLFMVRLVKGNS